jgi:hypothetical protein
MGHIEQHFHSGCGANDNEEAVNETGAKNPKHGEKLGPEPGWLPDDELTRDWLRLVEQYRSECDAADRLRIINDPATPEATS